MFQELTCIECPKGCRLTVEKTADGSWRVTGNQCPKGERYGRSEVQNPTRLLTSTVRAKGLALTMVPVRTSQPIPKEHMLTAMAEIKRIQLGRPVICGDIIVKNFMNLEVDLISTREVS